MTQFPDVRKTVVVPIPVADAFRVFTQHPIEWWPPTHVLVRAPRVAITIDNQLNGRFWEQAEDGTEATWGRIITWNPPHQLALTWRINGRWQPIDNDDAASEIEVTFTPDGPNQTVVELAHVKLHKHGADAAAIFRALDGPSPGETLELFAKAVSRLHPV